MIPLFLTFGVALTMSFSVAPLILKGTRSLKARQPILKYVTEHKSKAGTPTMGGLIFVIALFFAVFLMDKGGFTQGKIAAMITLSYAILGFLDDYIKIKNGNNEGLKPYQKVIGQVGIAIIVSIFAARSDFIGTKIVIPFSNKELELGKLYIPLVTLYFVAVTNAFNLTDGLDGLLGSISTSVFTTFAVMFFIIIGYCEYMGLVLKAQMFSSLLIFAVALIGSLLCFLCYNTYPAKIFMGDTGSLALGGAAATLAVFSRNLLVLGIVAITTVVSCISVILQVTYFKATKGKRIFLIAPLHHHLERKGIAESKIVGYYTIITIVFGVVAVISLYVSLYGFSW